MSSYETIMKLWQRKKWISNEDFYKETHSPKFTSRISDMRRRGVPIIKQMVKNETTGKMHAEYALANDRTN